MKLKQDLIKKKNKELKKKIKMEGKIMKKSNFVAMILGILEVFYLH